MATSAPILFSLSLSSLCRSSVLSLLYSRWTEGHWRRADHWVGVSGFLHSLPPGIRNPWQWRAWVNLPASLPGLVFLILHTLFVMQSTLMMKTASMDTKDQKSLNVRLCEHRKISLMKTMKWQTGQRIKLPCTNNFIGQRSSQSVSALLNVLAIFLDCYWFWITAFLLIYCLLTFLIASEMNGILQINGKCLC